MHIQQNQNIVTDTQLTTRTTNHSQHRHSTIIKFGVAAVKSILH